MLKLYVGLALIAFTVVAVARDNGQYGDAPPSVRQWFKEQKVPGGVVSCCDEADGDEAQEDVRNGKYWVTWPRIAPQWMQVPDEVVLNTPNKAGHPVVWYGYMYGRLMIRCYAPGAKL